jgi:D-serine deaminase-like pyridoxal phosphate-dependent protein
MAIAAWPCLCFTPGSNPGQPQVLPMATASLSTVLNLDGLGTPVLLLDEARMMANIARLKSRLEQLKTGFRPHLKTAKSVEIGRRMMTSPEGPATVSTLKEAEEFARAGVRDLLYAVGIAPQKLARVTALRAAGVDLQVILDSTEQAQAVATASRDSRHAIPALVEIDCDGHRSGVTPEDPRLIEIARILRDGGAELRGVMTHAGGSYDASGPAGLEAAAAHERDAVVACARALRGAGLACPVVSVGSTPTAHFARDLTGVTEARAGVFVFFDMMMAKLGVCRIDDIALSVLTTVIGHQARERALIVDAGWMALSRDSDGLADASAHGHGQVCSLQGAPYSDLIVTRTNQEHGVVSVRPGSRARCPELPIGTRLRILPHHACAAAAQHERYHLCNGDNRVVAELPRISGW